jgi:hypothetical protein
MSKNRSLFVLVIVLILVLVHPGIGVSQSSFEKLLTVPDVEKVTGLKGIKLLPQSRCSGAIGGVVCFAQQDGALAVDIGVLQGREAQAYWKQLTEGPMSIKSQGGKVTVVTGVGDEAFEGEDSLGRSFYFRKGKSVVSILSGSVMTKQFKAMPLISSEQIRALAKIAASRL